MEVHGRDIAADILLRTRTRVEALGRVPNVHAVVVAPTPATESYLRIKSAKAKDAGMELVVTKLPDTATTEMVIETISSLTTDAIIVQLPLPPSIDTEQVLAAIPRELDADCLSKVSRERGALLLPPVAAAVHEICVRMNVSLEEKKAVVIGGGWLVGLPVAAYLRAEGVDVTIATRETENLKELLSTADVVVSGAGVAGLITPDLLKQGVVLIDAGTSESNGTLKGDADPACAQVASVYTPVPGGVGPIAVACLFENVALLVLSKG